MFAASRFVLRVPVDVSQVLDFTPGRRISVLVWNCQGFQQQRLVTFEEKGRVTVTFELEQAPESLRVVLGPELATQSELRHLQTPCVVVPTAAWKTSAEIEIPAIRVSAWDWWWWQHWRQTFRVAGRVVNAYGRPVAGAEVSAFDVDAWWWWTAQEQVGGAVTGSDGSFSIEFSRCCGWWSWWWWTTREWQVDAALAERITLFLRQYPGLGSTTVPASSVPTLEIFQPLLTSRSRPLPGVVTATFSQTGKAIDPAALEPIRERLVEILPRRFPLPVWPWSEWAPWEDCGANLIFRVTETRGDKTEVLLNEGAADARWDIPTTLDVKLIARDATFYRSRPDWTLVDQLFPHHLSLPNGHQQCEVSGSRISRIET